MTTHPTELQLDRSAVGRRSRTKGATFERAVARDLRDWLGEDWDVRRTRPMDQRNPDHGGEFVITGPFTWPFAVECKAHKAFDLRQLWRAPVNGPLPKWWKQAAEQARTCAKHPLLVINCHLGENLAVVRKATMGPLGDLRRRPPLMAVVVEHSDDLGSDLLVVVPWKALLRVNPGLLAELP